MEDLGQGSRGRAQVAGRAPRSEQGPVSRPGRPPELEEAFVQEMPADQGSQHDEGDLLRGRQRLRVVSHASSTCAPTNAPSTTGPILPPSGVRRARVCGYEAQ